MSTFSGVTGISNGETLVSADNDGDGQTDFAIHCIGTINFNANDFVL